MKGKILKTDSREEDQRKADASSAEVPKRPNSVEGSYPGVFIAARKMENNGLILGARVDIITDDYSGMGTISTDEITHKLEGKVHLVERLTNNQTIAIIVGGLILLLVLYTIFYFSGINLSQFS